MTIYRYGPLIYNTISDEEWKGNYYWGGFPPVGYDKHGIPIDERGMQCLDMKCPLHPSYIPNETTFNSILGDTLPTLSDFAGWFEENFLSIDEATLKKYIIRWYSMQHTRKSPAWKRLMQRSNTIEELVDILWPADQT